MASRSKELLRNTVILMVGKIFTQFLSFFLLPLYTHTLATADYGSVDLVMSYITLLVPVVTVQQEMATFRFLVDVRGDEKKQAEIIATSIKSVLFRIMLFMIPAVTVSCFVQWQYAYLILACGASVAISNLFLQIARGFGKNAKYATGSVFAGAITLTLNLLLICVFNFGAESILISSTIANLCCSTYLFASLKIARYLTMARPGKELKKQMIKYSWPLVPNGISWWLINASDRTIVSIFLGAAANGIYAVANKIPSIISGFLSIFTLSWTESASVHINDEEGRDAFFSNVAKNTLRIFSSLGVLVIAILPLAFNIIIGEEYHDAYNYIPIAVVAVLLNCMVSIYSAVYVAKKMTKKVASTSICSAAINIVVDLLLVHFIGIYAAVISSAVAYLVMVVYRHFDIKNYVKIKYQASEIILATLGVVGISAIYYFGGFYVYIIGVIFATLYTIIMNRKILKKIFTSIKKTIR